MGWRERLGDKLCTPEDAVRCVASGHTVFVVPYVSTPLALCDALRARSGELERVRIEHSGSLYPWIRADGACGFEVRDNYATAVDREMVNLGRVEYLPISRWRTGEIPVGYTSDPDVFLVSVSPPDERGYCSFGSAVWFSRQLVERSRIVLAEVHEDFIRTGGENWVHVSEIDAFCEARPGAAPPPLPPRSAEEILVTEVVGTLVANELVRDRDTVQIGVGTVSGAVGAYLGVRQDLGIQTEIVTGGIADLVRDGVVTGKYKTLQREKVVGSACAGLRPDELAYIDGHPAFELYDFGTTDDVRMLVQHDNLVAINNALLVDLTGQIASEGFGTRVWTGVGGQTAFMIAAQYSRGGRSISVLPSSHLVGGTRRTRIVPMLPEGTVVTVPRTYVDHVVTEHGIATLRGKTIRERVHELISVAHPDFRAELAKDAARLYGISVT